MTVNMQTIKLGEIVHDGITYDVFADLTNLPPAGELDPQKLGEITYMALGLFEKHAKSWKITGVSLVGRAVTLSDQGAAIDGHIQKHEDLGNLSMPSGPLTIAAIWEGTRNEIVRHVSRFNRYYKSIIAAPNPDEEMQRLIAHLRKESKNRDADMLAEIRRQYLEYQAKGGMVTLAEALKQRIEINKK